METPASRALAEETCLSMARSILLGIRSFDLTVRFRAISEISFSIKGLDRYHRVFE
jgi:hypothetical protein